jgi:hyperosmotically inducible periplasmic protein
MNLKQHFMTTAALSFVLLASAGSAFADKSTSASSDDRALAAKVRSQLGTDTSIDVRDISVRSQGGVVHLSGAVHFASDKQKAEQDARGVPGVTDVRNELLVVP